ncbi:methylcrotonoyl-CoA carboxylase beta chain, mitochondrial-like isoform X5 [Vidua chalybeata]|uniref:methylcrotonoyl-CoA carboxylase beta chain, mitochondrial-like isoform X5 n=1 Tax=Vidua chalybeata TaxID=81927 RepID=UPI0023A8C6F0|nr:methylcrotonoyl-CoA carboxylase beta chain, mitochondrial-like isoform X5 [Vidua chalybeata]XP_053806598.1 methylcrotonoyl-CoA carboxylase beta chain, mitochondrial-like isoform X5 [Vidua chalybeata]
MSPARTRVSPHGPRGRPGTGVVPSRQNGVRVSPYDPRCHSAEGTRSVIPVARCPSALGAMWSPAPLCALGRRRPGPSAPLQPLTRLLQREYRQKTPTRLLQREYEAKTPFCLPQREYREKTPFCLLQKEYEAKTAFCLLQREYRELPLPGQGWGRTQHLPPRRFLSKKPKSKRHPKTFPVLDGHVPAVYQHVFEENLRNSEAVIKRYSELLERVKKGGGEHAILRHTQRNKKVFVRERLRLLLDGADFLELSPLAGLDMPYGDVPAAGCLTGIGRICGVWCVFIASDATVKGGTIYPIGVKKQLRAQEIAMENRLLSVHLVDSGGAFLPLQSELFPDKLHGGRIFYNEAIMSAMGIPQVAVVCGSCVAGGAYVPTMAEESVIIDKIGTLFLAGPPLVKAATGEDVSPEDLGGARLHSQVSGCSDHFAPSEEEAYECIRNVVSTLNCEPVPEQDREPDSPLYSPEELLGLAPLGYSCTLPVKLSVYFFAGSEPAGGWKQIPGIQGYLWNNTSDRIWPRGRALGGDSGQQWGAGSRCCSQGQPLCPALWPEGNSHPLPPKHCSTASRACKHLTGRGSFQQAEGPGLHDGCSCLCCCSQNNHCHWRLFWE